MLNLYFFLIVAQCTEVWVHSWTYEDLNTYYTHIIQHFIPIKEGVKPFQWKLRKMHLKLKLVIQNEVKKLLDAKIIFKVLSPRKS